jgi:dTDP-4-amino-4,6-dideoxygalactose transaminase
MNSNEKVAFLDLVTPHIQLEEELVAAFRKAIRSAAFIGGPALERFEANFAQFCGTQYCVGVANGTEAVCFALMALGIRPGDSVITVPNTFIATAEAISQAGAEPEFVDVDEVSHNMDPRRLRNYLETVCELEYPSGRLVSRRTGRPVTAVVPVHLYGQPADMDAILEIAEQYRLLVVEDACQAHGAEYLSSRNEEQPRWKKAGSFGMAAAFSFYPGKNLGACGEAGAVTTNDPQIADKIRRLRDHGQARKYYHSIEGYNGRLDAIQAAILDIKLAHLADWNEQRREAAKRYEDLFAEMGNSILLPQEQSSMRSIYHLYVIRCQNRDQLRQRLAEQGIDTGIHYPIPLHLQEAYVRLRYRKGDFPVAEKLAAEVLSLPMFPTLSAEDQRRVVDTVMEFAAVTVA